MVPGIGSFREKFKNYTDYYTIIGGTACDIFRGGSSGHAAEGPGASDLSFAGSRSDPAGKNEDSGAEYLFSGNVGSRLGQDWNDYRRKADGTRL